MVQFFFVYTPKCLRIQESRDEISKVVTCQIKNAARGAFFVRVESGDIMELAKKTFGEEKLTFKIEPSRTCTEENWETLRNPAACRKNYHPRDEKVEGAVVRTEDRKPRAPRREGEKTERKPVERTERKPAEKTSDKPRAERKPREDRPAPVITGDRPFKAFCIAKDFQAVEKYFNETLKTPVKGVQTFEGKEFGFLLFVTLDECRAARAAFKEHPIENVVVRPYIPRRRHE